MRGKWHKSWRVNSCLYVACWWREGMLFVDMCKICISLAANDVTFRIKPCKNKSAHTPDKRAHIYGGVTDVHVAWNDMLVRQVHQSIPRTLSAHGATGYCWRVDIAQCIILHSMASVSFHIEYESVLILNTMTTHTNIPACRIMTRRRWRQFHCV